MAAPCAGEYAGNHYYVQVKHSRALVPLSLRVLPLLHKVMRAQGALRIISQGNRTAANRLSGSDVSISRFCGRSSRLSGGCVLVCLVLRVHRREER